MRNNFFRNENQQTVILKNGSEAQESLVKTIMISLESLLNSNMIAFYELVQKCRDENHKMFGNTMTTIEKFNLAARGLVHQTVKDVVLSAVKGKELQMFLGDPIKDPIKDPIVDLNNLNSEVPDTRVPGV